MYGRYKYNTLFYNILPVEQQLPSIQVLHIKNKTFINGMAHKSYLCTGLTTNLGRKHYKQICFEYSPTLTI